MDSRKPMASLFPSAALSCIAIIFGGCSYSFQVYNLDYLEETRPAIRVFELKSRLEDYRRIFAWDQFWSTTPPAPLPDYLTPDADGKGTKNAVHLIEFERGDGASKQKSVTLLKGTTHLLIVAMAQRPAVHFIDLVERDPLSSSLKICSSAGNVYANCHLLSLFINGGEGSNRERRHVTVYQLKDPLSVDNMSWRRFIDREPGDLLEAVTDPADTAYKTERDVPHGEARSVSVRLIPNTRYFLVVAYSPGRDRGFVDLVSLSGLPGSPDIVVDLSRLN